MQRNRLVGERFDRAVLYIPDYRKRNFPQLDADLVVPPGVGQNLEQ